MTDESGIMDKDNSDKSGIMDMESIDNDADMLLLLLIRQKL